MRYSSPRPPYFRSQSSGLGRIKVFVIGLVVGAVLVFFGMTAWQSHQPVEIIVKNPEAAPTAATTPHLDDADYVWSEGGLVGVKIPKENDRVSDTVKVEGLANPTDGKVHVRVTELIRGKVVTVGEGTGAVKTDVPGTHGTFSIATAITPSRNQGTLEVSVQKNKNAKDVDTVMIPLQFEAQKKPVVSIPTKPVVPAPKPIVTPSAETTTPAVPAP